MPNEIDRAEIRRRGKLLYQQTIRAAVECEENNGLVVVIDVDTGEYRIDPDRDNPFQAAQQLLRERPDALLWGERIGYDAVFALDGSDLQSVSK
jgi:hypothetical protein